MLTRLARLFRGRIPHHIDQDYHRILSIASAYYTDLHVSRKKEFRNRLYHFLSAMRFGGLHGIVHVTREMRVLIGSAFIQLTFGLSSYVPRRFRTIYVLPRRYAYPGYGEPFLGHIDFTQRALYFSWQDVVEGFAIADDAVNVALHEMAHLLEAEEAVDQLTDQFFSMVDWKEWAEVAIEKLHVMRSGRGRFIKHYAATNMKEMFASCIEAFFEQSEDFRDQLPHIYYTLCKLLRQDPTLKGDPLVVALP